MNPQQQHYIPPPLAPRPIAPLQQAASQYAPSPSSSSFPPSFQPTPDYSRSTSTDNAREEGSSNAPTPLPTDLEDGIGSGGNNSPAPAPPPQSHTTAPVAAAAAPPPVKRSKALNFLKKKETKVNVKGTSYKIVDDEIILEDDPRGEAKIDENGCLLGGRAWKVHTFTSPMRTNPEKLYMLSIDAARCAGFRDSLYFFRRNPLIHKLSCSQAEKDRLIELGKLSGNLKSRAVTMVSARNVFKVMGATFVQDGKYILDDYYEGKSLAAGHKAGEPAFIEPYDPEKDTGTLAVSKGNAPPGATSLGLNVLIGHPGKPKLPGSELISSQIGGGLHATFGGNGLQPFGKSWDPSAKKAKPASHLTVEDWMYEYAKEVGDFNRRYGVVRKSHVGQVEINLGIKEKEEDCWETVEEEVTDDEAVAAAEAKPMPLHATHATHLPPPSYRPPPPPPPPSAPTTSYQQQPQVQQAAFDPSLPQLYGATSQQPSASSSSSSFNYSLPSVSAPSSSSVLPPPTPFAPPAPASKPKKKRLTKRFNPIRGFYELETNVPHVYRSTQPSQVLDFYRSDRGAHIHSLEEEVNKSSSSSSKKGKRKMNGVTDDEEEKESKRKRKRELELIAGEKSGIASLEYVSDEKCWNLESVGDGGGRGREPLIPGMWDFRAGPEFVAEIARLQEEEEMVGE